MLACKQQITLNKPCHVHLHYKHIRKWNSTAAKRTKWSSHQKEVNVVLKLVKRIYNWSVKKYEDTQKKKKKKYEDNMRLVVTLETS